MLHIYKTTENAEANDQYFEMTNQEMDTFEVDSIELATPELFSDKWRRQFF